MIGGEVAWALVAVKSAPRFPPDVVAVAEPVCKFDLARSVSKA